MHAASDSHGHHTHSPTGPALAHILPTLDLPTAPARAVDVGCGAGNDVRWLRGAGYDAVGVDTNPDALRQAASRTPPEMKVTWLEASATSLPLPDQSCVLVTDRGCLHHLPPSERSGYAAEVGRVLAAGGAWVIRDVVGHHHQSAELDVDAIRDLASGALMRVERCEVSQEPGAHAWLVAVLRRD